MQEHKIILAVKTYANKLIQDDIGVAQHQDGGCDRKSRLEHVNWMCLQVIAFVNDARIEKANRWLGYIQGQLQAFDIFTLAELKEHNRPDPDPGDYVGDR